MMTPNRLVAVLIDCQLKNVAGMSQESFAEVLCLQHALCDVYYCGSIKCVMF